MPREQHQRRAQMRERDHRVGKHQGGDRADDLQRASS